jgi:hypothetical protein
MVPDTYYGSLMDSLIRMFTGSYTSTVEAKKLLVDNVRIRIRRVS